MRRVIEKGIRGLQGEAVGNGRERDLCLLGGLLGGENAIIEWPKGLARGEPNSALHIYA